MLNVNSEGKIHSFFAETQLKIDQTKKKIGKNQKAIVCSKIKQFGRSKRL